MVSFVTSSLSERGNQGIRVSSSGKALSQTGGHGDFGPSTRAAGCCGGHSKSLGRTCDGVPEVLKATREELKLGADFIKVMCGGGVASVTDAIETVQFTPDEIQAITSTCRQMGRKKSTPLTLFQIFPLTEAIHSSHCTCLYHRSYHPRH
jgi:imidazolonepropionase-like amidohydrolase